MMIQFDAEEVLKHAHIGLPDDVFSFIASSTPMVNVDLLIIDNAKRILLAWRRDAQHVGWHIPGGIIRFKETFSDRIHKTALHELGSDVTFDPHPLKISEIIMPYQRRGHFISFLYRCFLPENYQLPDYGDHKQDNGCLRWHSVLPPLVEGQKCYESFVADFLARL